MRAKTRTNTRARTTSNTHATVNLKLNLLATHTLAALMGSALALYLCAHTSAVQQLLTTTEHLMFYAAVTYFVAWFLRALIIAIAEGCIAGYKSAMMSRKLTGKVRWV